MKENIKIIIPEQEDDINQLSHIILANVEKVYNIELLAGLLITAYALIMVIG